MFVWCIGSGSSGNSHALYDNNGKILLLDLGLPAKIIKKAIDYRICDVVGAVVSHAHLDHSKAVKDFKDMGIQVPHNGTENYGFIIKADNQTLFYFTDFECCVPILSYYKANHILVECNYQMELVNKNLPNYHHVLKGHCSLETCKGFITKNKTNALRTVILCHLSEENADPDKWKIMLRLDSDSPKTFRSDKKTLHELDERFMWEDSQMELLFD